MARRIIVSLVTAQTQSRKFGGDLKGEGGHFTAAVEVTPTWTAVSLPFASFAPPTWGDTAALTTPALDRLQAIDWSAAVDDAELQLYLDDIELY